MKLGITNKIKVRLPVKFAVLFLCVLLIVVYFQWGIDNVYVWASKKPDIENQQLISQITSARNELANIPVPTGEPETQLTYAQNLLAIELAKIPGNVDINHVIRDILEIGYQCNVNAIPLSTTAPGMMTLRNYQYYYWNIDLLIEGTFQNIAEFIGRLDGSDITIGTIKQVSIVPTSTDNVSSDTPNHYVPAIGNIKMIIYTSAQEYTHDS